jgi:hypothetical protein
MVAHLRQWIAERWGVTVKSVEFDSTNNREAVAWYDPDAVYIPKEQSRSGWQCAERETDRLRA